MILDNLSNIFNAISYILFYLSWKCINTLAGCKGQSFFENEKSLSEMYLVE